MINQFMHGVFAASLNSTALVVFFILLRKIFVRYIGASWNYYVWFSIFIPWITIWVPGYFWAVSVVLNIYRLVKPVLPQKTTHSPILSKMFFTLTNGTNYSLALSKLFFILWLIGTLTCLMYIIFRHLQFVLVLKNNSKSMTLDEQKIIKKALTNAQLIDLPRIYLSTIIDSPMVCHIVKSKIYLPTNFLNTYTTHEQKFVLQHEYFHFQRYDLLANAAMIILGCINWFNPMMFFAYRYFRHAQELSCDAMISKKFTPVEKKAYGYALLKTVINQSSEASAVSCWWNTGIELKERCQMLKFNQSKPIKALVGILILISTMCTTIAAVSLENRDALFAYSVFSAKSSDFVIKLFNNTTLTQPLHYSVKSQEQGLVEGILEVGDRNGEFITINGSLNDKATVEITIDDAGHIIWKGMVLFTGKNAEFYIRMIALDSNYNIGSNVFHNLHAITFDIISKK